jgi:hypothetical protein
MNNKLPDISFERTMNHNYMILTSPNYFGDIVDNSNDYRKKMLLENEIPGLLPVKQRLVNGEIRYYYKINSLQSLESLYNKQDIKYDELRHILSGCVKLFEGLEEYLLDGSQIILKPEYIYMNPDTFELYFVCYPEYEEDIREAFDEFVDMILAKIDHTDNNAVLLSYRVYRYTKNPNYIMNEIGHILELHEPQNSQPQLETENVQTQQIPIYQPEFSYSDEFEKIELESEDDIKAKKKNNGSIGIILCALVAFITMAIILGDRMTNFIGLKGDAQLYLYGIFAVSVAEMAVLVISRAKKRKRTDLNYC